MKMIKAKSAKASQKIQSLIHPPAGDESVDRVLVVYGDQKASIYYEAPAPKSARSA